MKIKYWNNGNKYNHVTFDDVPPLLVFVVFAGCTIIAGYYCLILSAVLVPYAMAVNAVNNAHELDIYGIITGLEILCMLYIVYYFGEIALACRKTLRGCWFK